MDQAKLRANLKAIDRLKSATGHRTLFACKAFDLADTLASIAPFVDGFAASSYFEAKSARTILGPRGIVQLTGPGLTSEDARRASHYCDVIVYNSISQLERLNPNSSHHHFGLRINPGHRLIRDKRYDPCRPDSKLGEPLDNFERWAGSSMGGGKTLSGVLIHTNFDSSSFEPLLRTVKILAGRIGHHLRNLEWINLGGGYRFVDIDPSPLLETCELLRRNFGLQVLLEPGSAIVASAVDLVSSVVDIFDRGQTTIAVLDTSTCHLPEVFEYQFEPDLQEHARRGRFEYLLAGASCLAGDIFGKYRFREPLSIGSRVTFNNAGAYSFVKASMFNGINLPSIYERHEDGKINLLKRYTYSDYARRSGLRICDYTKRQLK